MDTRLRTVLLTAAAALAALFGASDAHADGAAICTDVTTELAEAGADEDCDRAVKTLDTLATKPSDVVRMTDAYQAGDPCKRALDDALGTLRETCGDALDGALGRVSAAESFGRMEDPDELLAFVNEKLSFYYREEHPDPDDPKRTRDQVYPLAERQVCASDADARIWDDLDFVASGAGFPLCYHSSADATKYALGVEHEGTVSCVRADRSSVDEPATVANMAACVVAQPVTEPGESGKTPAKPKKPKPIARKKIAPKPDVDEVATLCAYWTDSVERFGDNCSALGKRMYRKARDTPWKLRDVPRDGSYDDALSVCTKAARASSHCALDKEFQRAMDRLGN